MRYRFALSLPLFGSLALPSLAHAQTIQDGLWNRTDQKPPGRTLFRLAQVDNPSGQRTTEPAPADPSKDPNAPVSLEGVVASSGRKPISFTVDTRFGFDKTSIFVPANLPNLPFEASVRRRIRTLVLSGTYPINPRTRLTVNVPYISQSTKISANGNSITQRGNGVGDVSVWVDHSLPDAKRRLELLIAAGLIIPTGKNPFSVSGNQLETGLGFYQPSFRLTARSTSVPLQPYVSLDYSTSFSRNLGGQKRRLPASYGGELGIFYTLGPQWATQTSVSLGKSSSPVLQNSGQSVGYLSQALNYRTGDRTSFRGSVDVGLTDDSTDAYVGLAMNSFF